MGDGMPGVRILGVTLARLDAEAALGEIGRLYDMGSPAVVAYANAHTLNLAASDPEFRRVLGRASLVLNDGAGVALAARLQGQRFPANLNGTDFTPHVLGLAARRQWRVFFLGGGRGVALETVRSVTGRLPHLQIAGTHHGYYPPAETEEVVGHIRAAKTDLLLVAFGNPRQELWLNQHLAATGARIGIGVGGFFDFTAGVVRRAPAWMNRCGLEWVYRLAQEPDRMWRRYLVGNPAFLLRVMAERLMPPNRPAGARA